MLEIKNLSKSYSAGGRTQRVIDNLTFTMGHNEVVALIGASGSGKSTLLNLISGIDTPDNGQVVFDGDDINALKEPHKTLLRRNKIGFVFQFFNLIPTLTLAENIALPLELTGMKTVDQQARVIALLDQIELTEAAQRYPDTLSGGEQQRVAIARALAHKPRLLLADEPSGNLDEATGERMIKLLTDLARGQGASVLIVTHSNRVVEVVDRVFKLSSGRLKQI